MSQKASVGIAMVGGAFAALLMMLSGTAQAQTICQNEAEIAAAKAGYLNCQIPDGSAEPDSGGPVDTTKQCKLDDVERRWITDNNDLREAATYLGKIIKGLGAEGDTTWPASGSYSKDKFGVNDRVAAGNRDNAREKFKRAQNDLKALVRLISGSANANCQKCFALNDWFVLRSAAQFIYNTRYLPEEQRVGAGAMDSEERPEDDLTVLVNGTTKTFSIGNDVTHDMMSIGVMRSQVDLMVQKLCDGNNAMQAGQVEERSKAAQALQNAFGVLAAVNSNWKDTSGASGAKMSKIRSSMKTNCNSPEFFNGELSGKDFCALAKRNLK